MSNIPDHDASAVMGEIYASLVMNETLSIEMRTLEVAAHTAENDLVGSLLATEEALALLKQERASRQQVASKLRLLQADKSERIEAGVLQELEQHKAKGAARERELRQALNKAQYASERHAAATQSLKVERNDARARRRGYATVRLASVLRLALFASMQRCFSTWSAKIAAGIFDLVPAAHLLSSADDQGPHSRAMLQASSPTAAAAAVASYSLRRESAARAAAYDAHEAHEATLAARDAECLELREHIAALEAQMSLEDARSRALQAAAGRAARASAELLEARRRTVELVRELAAANATIQRYQAEASSRSSG